MRKVPTLLTAVMVLAAVCCGASRAGADPLRVTAGNVRAGFGFLTQPLIGEGLGLLGDGFAVQSSLEEADAALRLAAPPTLAAGALADFSGILLVGTPLVAQFGGSFGLLAAPATLSFSAAPMSLVCSGAGSSTLCTGSAPFTFDANLTFTATGGSPVTRHLIGGGTVEATVNRVDSLPFGGVTFDFASPTPEPSTVFLFITGAIIAGATGWTQRRSASDRGGDYGLRTYFFTARGPTSAP
jgi:hypothetical protein